MSAAAFPIVEFNGEFWYCERHWSTEQRGSEEALYRCTKNKSKYIIAEFRWMIEVESQVKRVIAKYYSEKVKYVPDHLFHIEE